MGHKKKYLNYALVLCCAVATALPSTQAFAFFDMLSSAIPIASCISNPKLPFMSDAPPTEKAEAGKTKCDAPETAQLSAADMDVNFKAKCQDAQINSSASDAEDTSAIVYTIAFGTCLSECIYPYSGGTVCTLGTLAGMSADLAGAANVASKAEQAVGFLMQAGVTGGVDVMAGGSMGNTFSKMFADAPKDLSEEAKKKAKADQKGKDRKAACISTALNAAMAIGRACKAKEFNNSSIKSYEQAMDLHKDEKLAQISAASGAASDRAGGVQGGRQMEPGNPRSAARETKQQAADDKLNALAANAAFGPVAQAFQDRTGKSASEILNRMAAGQSPLQAAAETVGGDEAIQVAAQLTANGRELQQVFQEETALAESKGSMPSFESTAQRRSSGKQDSGMPDLAGMMAALMPKAPGAKEAGPQGATGANLRAPAAAKISSEGFHAPERSIFEIIDSRYQMIAKRVLDDGPQSASPAANTPASLVPKNPYLGK